MQSVLACGRVLARAVVAGLNAENGRLNGYKQVSDVHLLSAVAGFSKSLTPTQVQKKWNYGDDVCFVARHKLGDVIGVADGVGGWRSYGVDPSHMPRTLMSICSRMVTEGRFRPQAPQQLLATAYAETSLCKEPIAGSTTACLVSLDKAESRLHTANLGDSGFMLVRSGRVLARSQEQQHYFNAPFQLTVVPPPYRGNVICDSPSEAETSSIGVEVGDIILVASDGLFDNMSDAMILTHLHQVKLRQPETVRQAAECIASEARKLAFDSEYVSPFAQRAAQNGYRVRGGKPDDVTVIIAVVNQGELGEFVL